VTFSNSIVGLRITNNIISVGNTTVYGFETAVSGTVVIDRNLLSTEGALARGPGAGSATDLAMLRAWGYEATGMVAAPSFVDSSGADYRLASDSPAIDAGVDLPGVNDGYSGAGPDLGRYERP
jgi:hypothetical protein